MKTHNIHYAKTHLSRILEEVVEGEEVCIAKAGKPMVRMIAYNKKQTKRTPGMYVGKINVGEAYFEPVNEKDFWG